MNAEKTIIKIRRAELKDAAAVSALIYKSFAEYKLLYTDKGFEATTPMQEEVEERINKKAVWLVWRNDKMSGTVSIFPRQDELFIRSMAVSPEARGQGIGKILMEHVHEMAYSHGCSVITLNTTPFLLPAIRLYESFGFTQQGLGDLHGTSLIKMSKHLTPVRKNKLTIPV